MLDTLQKMSGTTHKTFTDSKTTTRDLQAVVKMTQVEGKVSYTMTTKEVPVISYNDMAFISERNSIVFRAGDSPIWNRNETILPMSWRLFKNTITQPGKEYSLQTIPTLSTAMDFDVRKNQPNFQKMFQRRMEQAYIAKDVAKTYQEAYGYSDYDISQLDPDTLSDEIMDLINSTLNPDEYKDAMQNKAEGKNDIDPNEYEEMFDHIFGNQDDKNSKYSNRNQSLYNEFDTIEDNNEQKEATARAMQAQQGASEMRYAGQMISRDMLVSPTGVNHSLDAAIIKVYKALREKMNADSTYFSSRDGHLYSADGRTLYIENSTSSDNISKLNDAAKDQDSRVYADGDIDTNDAHIIGSYSVTDAFLKYLVSFPKAWPFVNGEFESMMKSEMKGE